MGGIRQEEVIEWIKNSIQKNNWELQPKKFYNKDTGEIDNRGPDLIVRKGDSTYFIEAIAFNDKNKGKNQADFWKAFAQSISRLNQESSWGKPDKIVIALPANFKRAGKKGLKCMANMFGNALEMHFRSWKYGLLDPMNKTIILGIMHFS